jgi:perosamine synthetase
VNCALGLSQLRRLTDILSRRKAVAEEYRRQLADIDELEKPPYETLPGAELSWFVYVVRLKGGDRRRRDDLLARLRSEGIACSDYFSPLHLQPHLRELGYGEGAFPVTETVAASTVALPFYNALDAEQIHRIATTLRRVLGHQHGSQAAHSVRRPVL